MTLSNRKQVEPGYTRHSTKCVMPNQNEDCKDPRSLAIALDLSQLRSKLRKFLAPLPAREMSLTARAGCLPSHILLAGWDVGISRIQCHGKNINVSASLAVRSQSIAQRTDSLQPRKISPIDKKRSQHDGSTSCRRRRTYPHSPANVTRMPFISAKASTAIPYRVYP
jgi:hypothetical protein